MFTRLKVVQGSTHRHTAQKPGNNYYLKESFMVTNFELVFQKNNIGIGRRKQSGHIFKPRNR